MRALPTGPCRDCCRSSRVLRRANALARLCATCACWVAVLLQSRSRAVTRGRGSPAYPQCLGDPARMVELLLLRHAKSRWDLPGLADHDRDLAPRGERDAPRVG